MTLARAHQGLFLAGADNDPYWSSVALLASFDGADASTTFVDSGPAVRTLAAAGNAQLDTAQAKFGTASLLLDGTGDYASSADNAIWTLGASDFTLEAWVRFAALGGSVNFISHYDSSGGQRGWSFGFVGASNQLRFIRSTDGSSGTTVGLNSGTNTFTPSTNTWYAVAVVRNGTNVLFFVDGVLLATVALGAVTIFNSSAMLLIGASLAGSPTSTEGVNGWIDEVRITVGVARYAATYTPRTERFPRG